MIQTVAHGGVGFKNKNAAIITDVKYPEEIEADKGLERVDSTYSLVFSYRSYSCVK